MKKIFTVLFVSMGVLFLLQMIALAYFFVVDPYNLKPMLFPENKTPVTSSGTQNAATESTETTEGQSSEEPGSAESSGMTAAQIEAMNSVGLDADVAQSFTPEQIACFERLLGESRVAEIKGGAVPTMGEFYTVRECM